MLRTIYAHLLNLLPEPLKLQIFRRRMRRLNKEIGSYYDRYCSN